MKAMMFYAPGDIRMEEVPTPKPGGGEVLVEIGAALTCGTDVKTYRRGHPLLIPNPPSVFGHEFAGVIAGLGEGVSGFHLGQRVVAANSAPCGDCFYCKEGHLSLCENLKLLNGAYAEFIVVPERIVHRNLLPLPEHVTFAQAALVEPLACVLHGVDRTDIRLGDTVAVIGPGPIGLMFIALAKARGARVIAIGMGGMRLELARSLGADETVDVEKVDDPVQAVRDLTAGGRGADRAVEAVGSAQTWEQALEMVRPGGLANLFGGCPSGTEVRLDTQRVHYHELQIIGVFHHTPKYVMRALELISMGRLDTEAIVSAEYPLDHVEEALRAHMKEEVVKAAVIP